HAALVEQKPYFFDDMRLGGPTAQAAARAGFLSYVTFPIRAPATSTDGAFGPTIAVLGMSYTEVGAARHVPVDLVQQIADVVGRSLGRAMDLAREHRLARILGTSGDAMLAWDRHGRITDANDAAARLTGRSRPDLIGTPIAHLLDPLPRPCASAE